MQCPISIFPLQVSNPLFRYVILEVGVNSTEGDCLYLCLYLIDEVVIKKSSLVRVIVYNYHSLFFTACLKILLCL